MKARSTLLIVILAGCLACTTTQQKIDDRLQSFVGQDITDVLPQMRQRPDRVIDDGLGGKIYYWRMSSSEGVAWVTLSVDEKGKVWKWEWRAQPNR